jgi:acyl carrier protein
MTAKDIENGVRAVIAQNSRYTADEINLDDNIDVYISSTMADRLARKLKIQFPDINATEMTNDLFVNINTVQDIIDKIKTYYNIH